MAYYVRVLGTSAEPVSEQVLRNALADQDISGSFDVEATDDKGEWTEVELMDSAGECIAVLERNAVSPGSLAESDLEEFSEEMDDNRPESAAEWLKQYFRRIRVIYAFRILGAAYDRNGWEVMSEVLDCLREHAGGIVQADCEGFSNEDGHLILWQFSDDVSGSWTMAVLDDDGVWQAFEMELGNHDHRAAFMEGRVPDGVRLL